MNLDEALCDSMFTDCTVLPFIIKTSKRCTHPHSNLWVQLPCLYPSSRKEKKIKQEDRNWSEMKARGAYRESKWDTHKHSHTHRGISCELNGSELGGSTVPLWPLFEVRHRPYVQAPERGMSTPPHRLAEGSSPSRAHNTEKRMELPNWAAFSSHAFPVHSRVILLRGGTLRATKLSILHLMPAIL